MSLEKRIPASVVVVASRRRTPRLTPLDPIQVEVVPVLLPADVLDISFGGFAVETRCSLRVGASYQFRFTLISGRQIELQAQVVHCRRKATRDSSERYIAGCEFVYDPEQPVEALVDELVDSASQSLTFSH